MACMGLQIKGGLNFFILHSRCVLICPSTQARCWDSPHKRDSFWTFQMAQHRIPLHTKHIVKKGLRGWCKRQEDKIQRITAPLVHAQTPPRCSNENRSLVQKRVLIFLIINRHIVAQLTFFSRQPKVTEERKAWPTWVHAMSPGCSVCLSLAALVWVPSSSVEYPFFKSIV